MSFFKRRPSPPTVISLIALFVALGGTSYAATRLPRNSVGWSQLRANAVSSAKVMDGTLLRKDFRPGELPIARTAESPSAGMGPQGAPGPAGQFPDALPPGRTIRGYYDISGTAKAGATWASSSISFGFPLPSAPATHYIGSGDPVPAGCAGGSVANPVADPGHLCVYEGSRFNVQIAGTTVFPANDGTSTRFGAGVFARSAATFDAKRPDFFVRGTWAVTAP